MISESQYYGFYSRVGNISRGLNIGEDTITDILLLELSKKLPHEILTIKFSKGFEAREGVDWEWWILSAGGIVGIRIQAKKLHYINGRYCQLLLKFFREVLWPGLSFPRYGCIRLPS